MPGTRGTREQDEDVSKSWLEVGGGKSSSVLDNLSRLYKKSKQWPQDWKRSVFIPTPKKGSAKECSNYHTIALSITSDMQMTPPLWQKVKRNTRAS